MPSTYTSNLRLTLQADGENPSTWGDIANSVFQLIESAIAGAQSLTLTTGNVTLTTANGASDQAREAILLCTGVLSGNVNIIVPNVSKPYIVYNNTTGAFTVTITTAVPATGSTITVPQGQAVLLFCDGATNIISPGGNATTLNGIPSSSFARLDAGQNNVFQSQNSYKEVAIAYASPITLTLNSGNVFYTTLTGATTLVFPTGTPGGGNDQLFWYLLTQDSTGGRTVGFNAGWLFPNGVAATVDPTPGATTILTCLWSATLNKIVVLSTLTGYNGTTVSGNITIAQNCQDFNLFQQLGSPGSALNVAVTVNTGVRVMASSPNSYAMDLSGLPVGSVITLTNKGYILGRGGDGGMGGGQGHAGGSTINQLQGTRGKGGGTAIQGPGSGVTVNITNTGFIWGGGGGGGGGGAANTPSPPQDSNGGGGGGGAGLGKGGSGGVSDAEAPGSDVQGADGTDGTLLTTGANGSGGAGAGSPVGASGGNGGDWGTAGSAGTNSNTHGGAAGAAGKAVNVNSGTVSFASGGTAPNVKGAVS